VFNVGFGLETCSIFAYNELYAISLFDSSSSQKTSSKPAWNDHFEKAGKIPQINIARIKE